MTSESSVFVGVDATKLPKREISPLQITYYVRVPVPNDITLPLLYFLIQSLLRRLPFTPLSVLDIPGKAGHSLLLCEHFHSFSQHRVSLFADICSLLTGLDLSSPSRHFLGKKQNTMKSASLLAALGATFAVVVAAAHGGHTHQMLHKLSKKGDEMSPVGGSPNATCGCVTSVVTWYGEATRTSLYLSLKLMDMRILIQTDFSGPAKYHNPSNDDPY